MPDMLVKLYDVKDEPILYEKLRQEGITIKKVLPPDTSRVLDFVRNHFSQNWVNECNCSFSNRPISCYIAVKDKKIIGFACYDTTVKDYFGPIGVDQEYRGKDIGKALLLKSMMAMHEMGYAYAIIGWTNVISFYEKCVGATVIADSEPGEYERLSWID